MALELTDEFVVPLDVAETWALFTDAGQLAPFLPGARLEAIVDGEFRGVFRAKVGPVTVEYKGTVTYAALDEATHTVVLKASGNETRGEGTASATVTAVLSGGGTSTTVELRTELEITGKVAQFGRSVFTEVSTTFLTQLVKNLELDPAVTHVAVEAASEAVVVPIEVPAPPPSRPRRARKAPNSSTPSTAPSSEPAAPEIESMSPASEPSSPESEPPTRAVVDPPAHVASVRAIEDEPFNPVRLISRSAGRTVLAGVVLAALAVILRTVRRRRA
jgi:hypothetical protein